MLLQASRTHISSLLTSQVTSCIPAVLGQVLEIESHEVDA